MAKTIREVAREIGARLIVCGQRGRGAFASAVLATVSQQLSAHPERPVLIARSKPLLATVDLTYAGLLSGHET